MSLHPVTREDPVSLDCARIYLVGSSGVGKSSLLQRYIYDEFSPGYIPTVNEAIHTQKIVVQNKEYQMRIIDTVGAEDLSDSYESQSYEDTSAVEDCFLFCFSLGDRDSFVAASQAMYHISAIKNTSIVNLPVAVVGCKSDHTRVVLPSEVDQITRDRQISYHETSSKMNHLVNEVFGQIMRLFLDKQKDALQLSKKEAMNLSLVDACACSVIRPKVIKRKLSVAGVPGINVYNKGQSPLQAALRRPANKERRQLLQMLIRMNADPFQGPEVGGKGENVIEWLLNCRNLDGLGELLNAGMSHEDLSNYTVNEKLVIDHIIEGDFPRFSPPIVRFIIQCVVDSARLASKVCHRMERDDFEVGEKIGCGSFGKVFAGRYQGEHVAIKQIDESLHPNDSAFDLGGLRRELAILSLVQSPELVRYLGYSYQEPHYYIVTELASGNLRDVIVSGKLHALGWKAKEAVALDICKGMITLHRNGIAHRDLKTENILIFEQEDGFKTKIADFGISRYIHSRTSYQTRTVGTKHYMAPELMESEKVLADVSLLKADVYSFAYILWAIFCNKEPYDGSSEAAIQRALDATRRKAFFRGSSTPLKIPSSCPKTWKQVITACWQYSPEDRPTFRLILSMLQGDSKKVCVHMTTRPVGGVLIHDVLQKQKEVAGTEEEISSDQPDKGRTDDSDTSPTRLEASNQNSPAPSEASTSSQKSESSSNEEFGEGGLVPPPRTYPDLIASEHSITDSKETSSSSRWELTRSEGSTRFFPKGPSPSIRSGQPSSRQQWKSVELHSFHFQSKGSKQVSRWLEAHGFGAYQTIFRQHEIEMEDLPDLTRDDLWRMEIQKVGAVLKILRAIRNDPNLQAA